MAKVFGAEGSGFVSEEKRKTARIWERNGRGETDLFLNGKEEKGCAYANAPSATLA